MSTRNDVAEELTALLRTALGSNEVYPNLLFQTSMFPAVLYRLSTSSTTANFSGASKYDTLLLDLHIYARSYSEAQTIAEDCRRAIEAAPATATHIVTARYATDSTDYSASLSCYIYHSDYPLSYYRNP